MHIWVGYKIWVLAEAYGYRVQFEPYQAVQKGKQVASSTKWGLGENDVLWLINIWIFVSLPTLEYANALGTNSCKKERGHFKQRTSNKKREQIWQDNRAVYIASKSSESKRFARHLNKRLANERKYIQEQQPN